MLRLKSIRSRIFFGFLVLVLLQIGMSVLHFVAQHEVEMAAQADEAASVQYQRLMTLSLALRAAQSRLAEFMRVGDTVHQAAARSALTAFSVGSRSLKENGVGNLSATTDQIEAAITGVLNTAAIRRDAAAAIIETVVGVQNALTMLAQAVTRAPDRATADAAAAALAISAAPLTFASRYAVGATPQDGRSALEAAQALKTALLSVPQIGTDVPARVSRLVATAVEHLDRLEPAVTAFGTADGKGDAELVRLSAFVQEADDTVAKVTQAIKAERSQRREEALHAQSFSRLMMIAAAACGCLLGLLLAVAVGLSITRPIDRLAATMRRVSNGDLDCEVPDQTRRDEIGSMSQALLALQVAGLRARQIEAEADAERNVADAERRAAELGREAASMKQLHVVEALAAALSQLAAGDLVHQINAEFDAGYDRLRADFNATVVRLADTIGGVASTMSAIRSGSEEIAAASDDLARRTEQQAASLEQTAAALEQITANVRKTAKGAGHARDVVGDARDDADRSRQVVDRAVEAMDGMKDSAQKISQIIGLIDELAFQTNLLALNAGVEAARAGDAGRGFAVVASEVRALAQRSAGAAKDIKGLILASNGHVISGVELVAEAGEALRRIAAQVTDLDSIVAEIATAAHEQAIGLHEVNASVNQMDQVTQRNAAMVQKSTSAAHALAEQTETLAQMVEHFQIEPATGHSAPARKVA